MRYACVTLALFAGLAAGAQAQQSTSAGPPSGRARVQHVVSVQDRDFAQSAAAGGLAEVEAGKLALTRSQNPAVRKFGQRLVRDHEAADRNLRHIALVLHMKLPSRPLPQQQAQLHELQHLKGTAFDEDFVRQTGVADHEKTIALFQQEVNAASVTPALDRFAQQTLPVLQEHLKIAEQLQAQMQAQSSGAASVAMAGPGPDSSYGARQASAQNELQEAVQVVHRMKADPDLTLALQQAKGVFIMPDYGRGALGVGFQGGEGVLVTKHGGQFSDPAFYRMGGVSIGAQAGGSGGAVAYLLMSDKAVQQFRSHGHFSVNADAGLTVVAWSNRAQASGGKLDDVMVWSDTKGLYAGASVGVTDLWADNQANHRYYDRPHVTANAILSGRVQNPHTNVLGMVLAA